MGGLAGLLQRAEPRPHRQGGAPCVRGVLLRECQEQLRDAELRRVSLFVIVVVFLSSSRLLPSDVGACQCTDMQYTDVQPRRVEVVEVGVRWASGIVFFFRRASLAAPSTCARVACSLLDP